MSAKNSAYRTPVRTSGLLLVVMVGLLTLLLLVGVAFAALARIERRQTVGGTDQARAKLLARSGVEYAVARLIEHPDPAPVAQASLPVSPEEDWRFRGDPSERLETTRNPSYNHDPYVDVDGDSRFSDGGAGASDTYSDPDANGRYDGWSGRLRGTHAFHSDRFKLRIGSANSRIHVNGGALDEQDRDPDGPSAGPELLADQPGFVEVAPLQSNGIPDYKDASNEGPNGFLLRLLNNLETIVTGTDRPTLGREILEQRPVGGYRSLEDLKPVLGRERFERFFHYLTVYAWVDPKGIKPQPFDGRPYRWFDVDNGHRIGAEMSDIAGVSYNVHTSTFRTVGSSNQKVGPILSLNPGISGRGSERDPWIRTITTTNYQEDTKIYPVRWERNFVYAWHQLRLGPVREESRAPIVLADSPAELLASAFAGLRGTYLEVWDGADGWDGGFGFLGGNGYEYPSVRTEETPWYRTRVDYGKSHGSSGRPWYAPENYDPHAHPRVGGGKPVIRSAPLGRLRETAPLTVGQSVEVAKMIARRNAMTPLSTWDRFERFVRLLPLWEDVDVDGLADGESYDVYGSGGEYQRKIYRREEIFPDGKLNREVFDPASGQGAGRWWNDPGRGKDQLFSDQIPGLTTYQMDVLNAMVNPNARLNDFNPDANAWREVDKTDVAGIRSDPAGYVHTTELSLDSTGYFRIEALGNHLEAGGRNRGTYRVDWTGILWEQHRDVTQDDFLREYVSGKKGIEEIFQPSYRDPSPSPASYPLAGSPRDVVGAGVSLGGVRQGLVSHPEPQTVVDSQGMRVRGANASYDGRISLGFIAPSLAAPGVETIRGELFDTADAAGTADRAVPDLRGPFQEPLSGEAGSVGGNVFSDGVYSEKDRTLKYPMLGNIPDVPGTVFYVGCWVKPNWFPEASPRTHSLLSLSRSVNPMDPPVSLGSGTMIMNSWEVPSGKIPVDDISLRPVGLYFVPARNNAMDDRMEIYLHSSESTHGRGWPRRSLLWGTVHSLFASDVLNRRGMQDPSWQGRDTSEAGLLAQDAFNPGAWYARWVDPADQKPVGRLEGRRWQHVAVAAVVGPPWDPQAAGNAAVDGHSWDWSVLFIGNRRGSENGGRWNKGFGATTKTIGPFHEPDGTPNHLRFGEIAAAHNMNYAADATFANVRAGTGLLPWNTIAVEEYFTGPFGPAVLGRYYKEPRAEYVSPKLAGGMPLRITWTEISANLWFDTNGDGWSDTLANDAFGVDGSEDPNGLRDVRIDIEVWDDMGTEDPEDDRLLLHARDPGAPNAVPRPAGRIYYKGVFVNEWDEMTRLNHPLDVTPFLDDVTVWYAREDGPVVLDYREGGDVSEYMTLRGGGDAGDFPPEDSSGGGRPPSPDLLGPRNPPDTDLSETREKGEDRLEDGIDNAEETLENPPDPDAQERAEEVQEKGEESAQKQQENAEEKQKQAEETANDPEGTKQEAENRAEQEKNRAENTAENAKNKGEDIAENPPEPDPPEEAPPPPDPDDHTGGMDPTKGVIQ